MQFLQNHNFPQENLHFVRKVWSFHQVYRNESSSFPLLHSSSGGLTGIPWLPGCTTASLVGSKARQPRLPPVPSATQRTGWLAPQLGGSHACPALELVASPGSWLLRSQADVLPGGQSVTSKILFWFSPNGIFFLPAKKNRFLPAKKIMFFYFLSWFIQKKIQNLSQKGISIFWPALETIAWGLLKWFLVIYHI